MKGFQSKLVHGDLGADSIQKMDRFGSLRSPVYDSNAFEFDRAEDMAAAFQGKLDAYAYSRVGNPIVRDLESRLKLISEAEDALSVSSGMAALAISILALVQPGENIITTPYLFGHSYSFFAKSLGQLGVESRFLDFRDLNQIKEAINERTKVIFLENISNPQLFVYDVEAIGRLAKETGVMLIVDNTLPTPYIFHSRKYGVDIEVLSTTKSISGGATSVGGAILIYQGEKWKSYAPVQTQLQKFGDEGLSRKIRKEVFRNYGPSLSPHNAYLQILGLETLTLRLDKAAVNSLRVAEFLSSHSKVVHLEYPGLKNSGYYSLIQSQHNGHGGAMVLFELESEKACYKFLDNLRMVRRATNFHDNKSLAIHPFSTIYAEFEEKKRLDLGVNERMIRFSTGIEDAVDILDDIEQALKF